MTDRGAEASSLLELHRVADETLVKLRIGDIALVRRVPRTQATRITLFNGKSVDVCEDVPQIALIATDEAGTHVRVVGKDGDPILVAPLAVAYGLGMRTPAGHTQLHLDVGGVKPTVVTVRSAGRDLATELDVKRPRRRDLGGSQYGVPHPERAYGDPDFHVADPDRGDTGLDATLRRGKSDLVALTGSDGRRHFARTPRIRSCVATGEWTCDIDIDKWRLHLDEPVDSVARKLAGLPGTGALLRIPGLGGLALLAHRSLIASHKDDPNSRGSVVTLTDKREVAVGLASREMTRTLHGAGARHYFTSRARQTVEDSLPSSFKVHDAILRAAQNFVGVPDAVHKHRQAVERRAAAREARAEAGNPPPTMAGRVAARLQQAAAAVREHNAGPGSGLG